VKKKIVYALLSLCFLSGLFATTLTPIVAYAATQGKVDEIKAAGQLVVGVSADYKPYEFHAIVDGKDEIVGFDIDIAQAIANKLGVELVLKDMDFMGLLPALQAGSVDIVLAGMQATEERKQSVDFSVSYFTEKNVFVTKTERVATFKDKAALSGKRLSVQQGTTQEQAAVALAATVPDVAVVPTSNFLDAVQQVKNESVAGMIMSDIAAEVALAHMPELAIDAAITIDYDAAGASVALAKGHGDLLALINEVVGELLVRDEIPAFMARALEQEESTTDAGERHPFSFLMTYWPLLLQGAAITVIISFFSVLLGSIGGTMLALLRLNNHKLLQYLATAYVDFIRGTPLLIQIYIIFYGLPSLGLRLPSLVAGVLAMSINSTAYVAEIIRAGILAVDKGQFEAAASLGMRKPLMMKEIILPQALKNILPALGNEFVTIIKESSIISVISVTDLMFVANTIRGNTFQAFTPLIVVALIYFVLTFTLSKVVRIFEKRLDKNA
jgi:polar amino acid transport system substrate-binding protein